MGRMVMISRNLRISFGAEITVYDNEVEHAPRKTLIERALTFRIYRQRRDRDQCCDCAQRKWPGVRRAGNESSQWAADSGAQVPRGRHCAQGCRTFARIRSFRDKARYARNKKGKPCAC